MNQSVRQHETPAAVRAKLDSLRFAVRRYVWLYGVAMLFCAIGTAFWVSLVLDWFFEPPAAFRVVMQLAVAGTVLWLFHQVVVDRLRCPLTDANMALLLERQFPVLGDSLLTIVDPYSETDSQESDLTAFLYREARNQAARSVGALDIRNVFDYKLLHRGAIGAGILWLLIAIFVALSPGTARIWAARVLGLSEELWPRQTWLELAGAEGNTLKVARGDDLQIAVKADMTKVVPETVRVQRTMESGREEEKPMTREGEAVPGRDSHQLFTHTFHAVREPFLFYMEGGDAKLGPIRVEVVDSPAVASMTLRCRYPAYMQRAERDVKVIGPMSLPQGTRIRVFGMSAKPLTDIRVERVDSDPQEKEKNPIPVVLDTKDTRLFQCELPRLTDQTRYRFTLEDTDGIQGRDPFILSLMAVGDEAPVLPDDLYGIGPSISPNAYLPIRGLATDDHGIARIWYDYTIHPEKKGEKSEEPESGEEQPSGGPQAAEIHGRKPIVGFEGDYPREHKLAASLDLKPRRLQGSDLEVNDLEVVDPRAKQRRSIILKPGQKLAVIVSAIDRCTLGAGANVGSSSRRILKVVTPEALFLKLEGQELIRRQRFEAIIREVIDTQSILMKLEFTDRPDEAKRLQDHLSLRRARENCRKHAEETRAVIENLENIRLQIIHNRLDEEKVINAGSAVQRLGNKVIVPLKGIVGDPSPEWGSGSSSKGSSASSFPELEQEIEQVLAQLDHADTASKKRDETVEKLDAVLKIMNEVLAHMIAQEDFDKLFKILKGISQSVQKMNFDLEEQKRNELKGLLEEDGS